MLDNYVYHTVVGSNSIYLLYVITNFSTLPCLLPTTFKPRIQNSFEKENNDIVSILHLLPCIVNGIKLETVDECVQCGATGLVRGAGYVRAHVKLLATLKLSLSS